MTLRCLRRLWEKHRAAWDRFVDLTDLQIEQIEIPYEGTTLPGYFFRSGPAGEPRRTLIYQQRQRRPGDRRLGRWRRGCPGSRLERGDLRRPRPECRADPPASAVPAGLGEGHHPGRGSPADPPDVDAGKIALLGVSQAGYWVTRSVAFEHRIAAAVVDPGVIDVSTTMYGQIPHFLARMIDAGEQEKFDKDMELALRFSPSTRSMMAFRMRPYGATSAYQFFAAARAYALTDEVIGQITCPVLVTDPDNEQFWPGQSRELYDKLPAGKTLIRFTEEEGADSHCEPAAKPQSTA